MNRLLILGNGFDLAHGMKTSYSDFMIDLLKRELQLSFSQSVEDWEGQKFKYIKDPITITRRGYLRIDQRAIKELEDIETFQDLKNFTNQYNITIGSNASNSIFGKTYAHLNSYNWADVEAIYYENLLSIIEKNPARILTESSKIEVTRLNQELDFFRNRLIEYLTKVQDQIKAIPFEGARFWQIINSRIDGNIPGNIHILNFNYTNTISKYRSSYSSFERSNYQIRFNNIHGQLEESESVIFGYGDEVDSYYKKIEDLNDNEALRHAKSFGYFKNRNYKTLLAFLESGTFEVWIIGHSCGLSDRVMLKKIFEHSNCDLIKIYHYSRGEGNDHTEKTQQISRHFSDKELMRERIKPLDPSDSITELIGIPEGQGRDKTVIPNSSKVIN